MNNVNEAWELFVISEYIIFWYEYYLNVIFNSIENEDE